VDRCARHSGGLQISSKVQAAFGRAGDHADGLADALSAAHNLSATLHAAGPAAPAA
jgi:hypothetical protein